MTWTVENEAASIARASGGSIMEVREVALQYVGKPVRVPAVVVQQPKTVAKLLEGLIDTEPRERFAVLHLDARQRCTALELVSVGTLQSSLVHPREVFRGAILGGAAAIILGHSHPSGEASASREDREITQRLKKAGEILGVRVLDHVIVAGSSWESGREAGWFDEEGI